MRKGIGWAFLFSETTMEIQWHLEEDDFFRGIPGLKEEFLKLSMRREAKKGDFIFLEGDPGVSAFYLEAGEVRIFRVSPLGKEPNVFVRKSGEMFGLAEAITGRERKANAQAITPCRFYEIKRDDFEQLLSLHFVLAKRVMEVLSRRLRFLGEQVENLMVCDVSTRLLKLLVYLCYRQLVDRLSWAEPITVPVKLTQEQMASMTGSCQQTISETLKSLQQEGLILVSRKGITLLNPARVMGRIYL